MKILETVFNPKKSDVNSYLAYLNPYARLYLKDILDS